MMFSTRQVQSDLAEEEDENNTLEEKFTKLKGIYEKLREEHMDLLRHKADMDKRLSSSKIFGDDDATSKETMEKEVVWTNCPHCTQTKYSSSQINSE